jgi:hypothetical protein
MRFHHPARPTLISCIIALVTLCGLATTPAMAQRVVLDFEGLKGMTFWSRSPIPAESRLSDTFLRTFGVQFSSGNSYVAVVENGIDHAVSGRNGIGGATTDDKLTYDSQTPVVARFFDPANPAIAAVTDFVSARGDLWGSGLPVTLKAFDVNGNLLTETSTADSGGETLVVSSPGIHSVEFHGTIDDAGVALDDFTFNRVRSTGISAAAMPPRIVLDFEGFGGMTFISRNTIPPSARLSDAFLFTDGVRFSSGSPFVAVTENGVGHAPGGKNGIGGSTPDGKLTYDRTYPIMARFFDPKNPAVPAVTDYVSVRGDLWGGGQTIVLNAYDLDGKRIGSSTVVDDGNATMTIATPGIHYIEFLGTQDDGGVSLDNLTFNPVVPIRR